MTIIFFSSIITALGAVYWIKRAFVSRIRLRYEKSLMNGDKEKSVELGRHYYLSLSETTRKAKGILDIEEKISEDFRSFTSKHLTLFL